MKKILLLRPEEKFEELNIDFAEVINFPLIRLVEDDFSLDDIKFDTIVFTSSFAYISFKKRLGESIKEVLNGKRIIAIGDKTSSVIDFKSIVPERQSWRGIVELIEKGENVLIVRSRDGNKKLPEELRRKGAVVKTLDIYHSEVIDRDFEILCKMFNSKEIDAIIFSSGMIVNTFFKLFDKYCINRRILPKIIVSIGEETSIILKNNDINFIELEKPDILYAIKKICGKI
ncbi:MAG: uroporphyrinogen-III synthase [Thermoplasmata archaeon]|nr:uroporphyrinogen-III synthase [Thermoplasmata archaeon]